MRVQHGIELLAMGLRTLNRLRKNSSSLVTKIHTDTTVGIPLINNHGCSLAISQSFEVFWVKYFHSDFKWQIIHFLNPDQCKTFKIVVAYILCLPILFLYSTIILKKKNMVFCCFNVPPSLGISVSHIPLLSMEYKEREHIPKFHLEKSLKKFTFLPEF